MEKQRVTSGKPSKPTNAAISVKIKELREKPAYSDISHPDHKTVQDEVMKLYAQKSA